MAIKTYRPTTQTLRYRTSVSTDDITTSKPHKPLVEGKIAPADGAIRATRPCASAAAAQAQAAHD
jgi:ribosomal protein L2